MHLACVMAAQSSVTFTWPIEHKGTFAIDFRDKTLRVIIIG